MPNIADHIKKVAVVLDGASSQCTPQFIELDQTRDLTEIIKDLAVKWNLSDPENHALQMDVGGSNETVTFITQKNRGEIKNGNVLHLTPSPAVMVQNILKDLQGKTGKLKALKELAKLAADNTFAEEFISNDGQNLLIKMVEEETQSGEALELTLKAFVELMDHGLVSWDILQTTFIQSVCCVAVKSGSTDGLRYALEIVESIVLQSSQATTYDLVTQQCSISSLVNHLTKNADIQKSTLALINALFIKAPPEQTKKIGTQLQAKITRTAILEHVLGGILKSGKSTEMAHQLYVLQSLLFNLNEERMRTLVDINDPTVLKVITELRKTAFDSGADGNLLGPGRKQSHAKDHKRLGFQNDVNPAEDLTQVPPGLLALDNMCYFSKQHSEDYIKVVLENACRSDEHDCPFARASIELTALLCDILKVGEPPMEENQNYHPMFFTHEHPFEEMYCICIQLLNKTWKEMRATSQDFVKVMTVVREQINRALLEHPSTMEGFRERLSKLNHARITELWEKESRNKEDWEAQAKPILELREHIKPEILELIKQQRLNCLVGGCLFQKAHIKSRNRERYWFCRLSPNYKVLHYGDCEESAEPAVEQLSNKLSVVDIKELLTGKDCPHVQDKKLKGNAGVAFSIIPDTSVSDGPETLDFIARNADDFCMWTDGINALLGKEMTSKLTEDDLETLLSMEIKLRLLDTEGIDIPEVPPRIPPEPDNYDFAYE